MKTPTSAPRFAIGQGVKIQPTPQSQPLFGEVTHVEFNDSFNAWAYTVELTSGDVSTAWEEDLTAGGGGQ